MRKITVRLEDDVFEEYLKLQNILHVSGNRLINTLIRAEYNHYEADPEYQKAIDMLNEANKVFADLQKKMDEAGFAK